MTTATVPVSARPGRLACLLGAAGLAGALTACEPAQNPGPISGAGVIERGDGDLAQETGIAGVHESASSLPGRTVARARNLVDDINANQSRTTGLAADIGGAAMVDLGTVRFPVPAGWEEVPPANSMRLAEMSSPGGGVVTFSRFGGDFDSNITRWIGQFSLTDSVERRTTTISGRRVDTVAVVGTYQDGMMTGTPTLRDGWALYGAVIEEDARSKIFVKLTGPADGLEGDVAGYAQLLNGMQAE